MAHRVLPRAIADLDEIWLYVAEESGSPAVALRLVDSITERFYVLSEHPYLGRRRHDLREGQRSHAIGNYLIFYRIVEKDVFILRIMHGRRDIGQLFASADDDPS
jgi:toxin ParE1/3/4